MNTRNALLSDPQTNLTRGILTQLTLAGAAVLTGSAANAQIVYSPVNTNIGFAVGEMHSLHLSLPNGNPLKIFTHSVGGFAHRILLSASSTPYFRGTQSSLAATAPAGKTFNSIGVKAVTSTISIASNRSGAPNAHPRPVFTDQYLAFSFKDAGQTDYGWIEASLTDNTFANLSVDIISYAYQPSGAKILTGDTGMATTPEPSPLLALAALSVFSLGAVGMRRLKALQN